MVAKRNAEVEKLNALARERDARRRAGSARHEIEVGGARFAAGDQVITRVNDHDATDLQPRALAGRRGRPGAGARRAWTASTRARAVEVDSDYLARTNPNGDAPALQHAYAVTTYSRAGSDRGSRLRDGRPLDGHARSSTSRPRARREETYLYATPEITARPRGDRAALAVPARGHLSTSPKQPSATAPRSPPTTRRSAPSCRALPTEELASKRHRSLRARPARRAATGRHRGAGRGTERRSETLRAGRHPAARSSRSSAAQVRREGAASRRKRARRIRAQGSRKHARVARDGAPVRLRPAPSLQSPSSFSPSAARR